MGIELAIALGICGGMVIMSIISGQTYKAQLKELEEEHKAQDESWRHQVDNLVLELEEAKETIARLQDINHDLQVQIHG